MPVIYFSQENLNKVDPTAPEHNAVGARSVGGCVLKQVSTIYKKTKVKAAIRLASSNDKLQAVRQFQEIKEKKGRRSTLKDARKYAMDIGLTLEMGDNPNLSMTMGEGRAYMLRQTCRVPRKC